MNAILSKLRDFVKFSDTEEYEYYEDDQEGNEYQTLYQEQNPPVEEEEPAPRRTPTATTTKPTSPNRTEVGMGPAPRSNVIGMPGVSTGIAEVVVFEPRSFEEMPQVIQALRERRTVVLNLNIMDPDEAQRSVDFVAGGTYAIDGHQERIGESIFLFTPSCVQVSTQSGVVHEVPSATPARPATPAPAWEAMAQ